MSFVPNGISKDNISPNGDSPIGGSPIRATPNGDETSRPGRIKCPQKVPPKKRVIAARWNLRQKCVDKI